MKKFIKEWKNKSHVLQQPPKWREIGYWIFMSIAWTICLGGLVFVFLGGILFALPYII